MTLEEKISQDYVTAMKARDTLRSSVVNLLRSQIKNVKIDTRVEKVADETVVSIIKKQIKQRQDSISQFTAGGRLDLAEKEEKEAVILQEYLPAQASPEMMAAAIDAAIKETAATSIKDMGKVMKEALVKLAGQADNQQVSAIVKERLSKM
ncbi:MAG: GatB/YqeY domain-containing protein [Candidatus Omnitrophica bacterium]|nr:GatB/YqeY domain-containing protein [Candidatus Omnitrophota bacterium]